MKPGTRMMLMDKIREPKTRSEYGGDNGRRMIGYDRDTPKVPERERVPATPKTPAYNWDDPRMAGAPVREWQQPQARGYAPAWGPMPVEPPAANWGRPPVEMYTPGWNRPPADAYGGIPYEGYNDGPEMRRRRDRRDRYMMAGAEPEDDEEDEKHRRNGSKMIAGGAWADGADKRKKDLEVDEQKARMWTGKMQNPDGTTGPHFKPEIAEQLRVAHCPKCDKWEFFVALNMMYADYCEVAKRFAADKPEFYVHMAKAFLEDPDAGEGKLAKYMEYIPE